MVNILIPTDFTPASVEMAERALQCIKENNVNCIFFHAFSLPSSPHDLLGSGYREPSASLMNEPFRQACKQLKNDYPKKLYKILVRCMNGDTRALFRNFIDANDIDLICCPDSFTYTRIHERSLDPTTFFEKSGLPILRETITKRQPLISSRYLPNIQLAGN